MLFHGWSLTEEDLLKDYNFNSFGDGIRENYTVGALNIKWEDNGLVHVDIDLGGAGTDLVGLAIHIAELLNPGKTNPLQVYTVLKERGLDLEYECSR